MSENGYLNVLEVFLMCFDWNKKNKMQEYRSHMFVSLH